MENQETRNFNGLIANPIDSVRISFSSYEIKATTYLLFKQHDFTHQEAGSTTKPILNNIGKRHTPLIHLQNIGVVKRFIR